MEHVINLGTLFFDGVPQRADGSAVYKSGDISLGDGVSDKEIQWLCLDKKLVAVNSVCYGVKWKTLQDAGFIEGKQICISGLSFRCRIPAVWKYPEDSDYSSRGARETPPVNPQDETLLLIQRSKAGCTAPPTIKDSFWVRILEKKGMDARDSSYTNPDGTVRFHGNFRRTNTLGWVPILEPINKMPVEEHLQEKMVFLVPGAVCIGTPVESSNYDIVVCMSNENIATFYPSACPGKGIWWDQIGDNRFVLDKTQIIHCQTL